MFSKPLNWIIAAGTVLALGLSFIIKELELFTTKTSNNNKEYNL